MILVHKKLPLLPQFANASLRLVCDELLPVCTGGTNSKPATLLQGHPGNMAVVLFAMGFYGCGCERRCCAALRCAVLCCNVGDPSYPCGCPQKAACAREKSTRGSGHSLKRDVNFGIEPLSAAADLGWRIRTSDNADEVAVAQDLHPKARRPPTPALLWALGHSRTGHCGCGQPVYVCLPGFPCPHPPRPRQAPWPLTCPLLTAVSSLAPAPASSPHPIPPHPHLHPPTPPPPPHTGPHTTHHHPTPASQLAVGMTIFFALGALGGSMSMLMQVGAGRRAAGCSPLLGAERNAAVVFASAACGEA